VRQQGIAIQDDAAGRLDDAAAQGHSAGAEAGDCRVDERLQEGPGVLHVAGLPRRFRQPAVRAADAQRRTVVRRDADRERLTFSRDPERSAGERAGTLNCMIAETCPAHIAHIPLSEALERYRREAVHGVCDTGRYRCPYYTWGEGPTLLLVPGLADDSH